MTSASHISVRQPGDSQAQSQSQTVGQYEDDDFLKKVSHSMLAD